MTKKQKIGVAVVLVLILIIVLYYIVFSVGTVESRFEEGHDGWRVTGDVEEETTKPTYHNEGGNPGGYLSGEDKEKGQTWFWIAPDKFLGDKSSYLGGSLTYDLKQEPATNLFEREDVTLAGPERTLHYKYSEKSDYPDTTWTHYEVPLRPDEWMVKGSDDTATSRQMRAVLSELENIHIRGEYRAGNDVGGLDNVILRP